MCRPPPCPCCVDVTSPRVTRSPGCRLPCWPGGRWRSGSLTGSTWRRWLRRWMWHSGWRSRDILHLTCPSSYCDFVHCLLFTGVPQWRCCGCSYLNNDMSSTSVPPSQCQCHQWSGAREGLTAGNSNNNYVTVQLRPPAQQAELVPLRQGNWSGSNLGQ